MAALAIVFVYYFTSSLIRYFQADSSFITDKFNLITRKEETTFSLITHKEETFSLVTHKEETTFSLVTRKEETFSLVTRKEETFSRITRKEETFRRRTNRHKYLLAPSLSHYDCT